MLSCLPVNKPLFGVCHVECYFINMIHSVQKGSNLLVLCTVNLRVKSSLRNRLNVFIAGS